MTRSTGERWVAPGYFALYMAYSFWRPEGELLHWVTLVTIPFLLLLAFRLGTPGPVSSTLASLGLRRNNLRRGLGVTLLLGIALGLVQVFLSRSGPAVMEAFANGSALYLLPYAYFNPAWPSSGDWGAAWSASLGQGIPAGLILGGLFLYSRKNLLACIILHALIDAFPAMTMIRFGGS